MKVSEFLNNDNISPLLLGAFYSRYIFSNDNSTIYTEVSYKSSKFIEDETLLIRSKNLLLFKLNNICSPYSEWKDCTRERHVSPQIILRFNLDNDLNLSKDNFYNRLNVKILSQDFIYDNDLNENKKMFIRGFAESRGSIDTTRPLLAMDYFYNSLNEVKRARMLYDYFNVPFSVLNFNPRELQNDYVTGRRKRNTQLRFNLFWYVRNIGMLNDYKIAIISKVYNNISYNRTEGNVKYFDAPEILHSRKDTFDFMLRYYSNNIFNKQLSDFEVENLRKELNFDNNKEETTFKRDLSLIELIRINTPDECSACKTTQTYIHKNTGKQYFEYHHVISLGKNHELDDEDNIVKLCPNCHKSLKRGSSPEYEQKQVILKKQMFEQARQEELRKLREQQKREERRMMMIEEERRSIILEHFEQYGPESIKFLPPGVLREEDLDYLPHDVVRIILQSNYLE